MTSSISSHTSGSDNESVTPFSKREIKSNPVMKKARQTRDETRERRRDLFMKKIEQGREDKQWKGRSEQVCIYMTRLVTELLLNMNVDSQVRLHVPAPEVGG
jgi:hypothetical protein